MYSLPNAKINIGLRVVGQRPDGYHDLQTVFYPIPLTDSLEVKRANHLRQPYEFILSGLSIPDDGADNLVVRVFKSMHDEFDLPPTSIFLCKHIPAGAGLGGGSSDAAAMMMLLNDYYQLDLTNDEMEQRISAFGADCAFFIRNKAVYAEGIGNEFSTIDLTLKGMHFVLVKPDIHVSTAEAYTGVTPSQPQSSLKDVLQNTPVKLWRNVVTNDFESSVFRRYPQIAAIKETLYDMGAVYASMSGSGSAVYALFTRPVDNAHKVFPDSFTFAGKLM
ncbi:MAG: 4-(cytidine 5'-diphospho)-2-C-methyl-D-erythritol kinase [Bacteroidaceae bacterium]|nr:4-(cytidine 5'-diphospho)-2-C-methyl-D-erythritol kinase [Bacteroidaceae bacterium]